MARPTPPPQHPQIRNHAPIPRCDDQEGNPMTDEWMRHPVTGLTAPHHATHSDAQAQEAPVDVQDTQKAREERWAEAIADFHHSGVIHWDEVSDAYRQIFRREADSVMALADEEVLAAITVARQDVAQCVAERNEARAEVERLTGSLEIALRHLTDRGHPEDVARYARLHIEAALAGRSRPLILEQRRAEAAEAREVELRERIKALADEWDLTLTPPRLRYEVAAKQIRAALAAEPTPPAAPHAEDGAKEPVPCNEFTRPHGSHVWFGRYGPGEWDFHVLTCPGTTAPVADPSGTGETR